MVHVILPALGACNLKKKFFFFQEKKMNEEEVIAVFSTMGLKQWVEKPNFITRRGGLRKVVDNL